METLHLIHKPHSSYINGLWVPADHISQEIALRHFSAGYVAISYDRLDEIIYIAGLHGWKVTTEGDPKFPGENAIALAPPTLEPDLASDVTGG